MKKYDYKKAYNYIESHKEEISEVSLGIHEDWFWTAEAVWKNGKYEVGLLSTNLKIAGIFGSKWATPVMQVEFKDGSEKTFYCFQGESDNDRPSWLIGGDLSGPVDDARASIELQEVKQMKFRVGDIIKGTDESGYNITNANMTKGKVIGVCNGDFEGEDDIRIEILEHTNEGCVGDKYPVKSKYFELVEPAPFGKSDLKVGQKVRYRNGGEHIVLRRDDEMVFTSFDGSYMHGSDYAEDLTVLDGMSSFDIVEVLEPEFLHRALVHDCEFISIWKREEEPIEITIEEIADWKGVSPERIRIKED